MSLRHPLKMAEGNTTTQQIDDTHLIQEVLQMASNIVRFDPFEDLSRLQREVNRLFDDSSRPAPRTPENTSVRTWAPTVDIREDNEEIVLLADLPGVKLEDVNIELSGDTLTVSGQRSFNDTERKESYVRVERAYGAFRRAFTVGVPIKQSDVSASYRDGILEVHLPKSEEIKPKKITIAVN